MSLRPSFGALRIALPLCIAACGSSTSTNPGDGGPGGDSSLHDGSPPDSSATEGSSGDGSASDGAGGDSTASGDGGDDASSDGQGGDGGSFACGNDTCDANTQLCLENTSGDALVAQCSPLPGQCGHDCNCIKLMFQCPVTCTDNGGQITVVCP